MDESTKDYYPIRWKFHHESGIEDKTYREFLSDQIDNWWIEFFTNHKNISDYFSKDTEFDISDFMSLHLHEIHSSLFWEFGPAIHIDGHRLVITSEARKDLRPLVHEIIKRAPKLEGWEFYEYRLPESLEIAELTVRSRTGGSIVDLQFTGSINEFNEIDLTFFDKSIQTNDDNQEKLFSDVFIALECLLGEEAMDKWIGFIEVAAAPEPNQLVYNIHELNYWFKSVVKDIRHSLPDRPHYEFSNDHTWSMFELEPEEQEDYILQMDIFVGKSVNEYLWRNTHSNHLFYSERFSNKGEIFCYLKIDGNGETIEDNFKDKAEIEDALDEKLIANKLGSVIGGGTGLRYSYIDLALIDLEKGLEVIKTTLREAMVSKRSWLLFFDSIWQTEWIGIWDDSPEPPLPDFEA